DRNHRVLSSRPEFDAGIELAGLEQATSWVRSVGDGRLRGLQGTLSRSWGFRRVSESPSLPRSTHHPRPTRAASCVFPAHAGRPAFIPRALVREWHRVREIVPGIHTWSL